MRITQGTFSYLPDLTDAQIEAQLRYALRQGWAIMVEHTDDPHPRNALWEMWAPPQFDLIEDDVDVVMSEIRGAREAWPHGYVKVVCYDRSLGRQTTALAFVVGRPPVEPGFAVAAPGEGRPPDPLHDPRLRDRRALRAPLRGAGHGDGQRRTPRRDRGSWPTRPPRGDIEARARAARCRPRRAGAGEDAHPRDRGAARHRSPAPRAGPGLLASFAAHELHRQPRHGEDDRRAAHGRDPAPAGLRREAEGRVGHPRRPRRPVRRPHRPEDPGGAQARPRRRALHRRGLLPLPPRERARLRPGGDRDPAAGHGGRARRPRRRPGGLPRSHGDLLPLQPGHGLARRAPHPLPRLRRAPS